MSTLSRSARAIRARQKAINGKHICAPRPKRGFGWQAFEPCPHYAACSALPLNVDALCELSDEAVGIDTMTESPFGGWDFEVTIKATKAIEDPLEFGEDE